MISYKVKITHTIIYKVGVYIMLKQTTQKKQMLMLIFRFILTKAFSNSCTFLYNYS